MREETDQEILEGLASGSRRAFRQLYERYARQVHAAAWRIVGNEEDAEEATQDAFLALARLGPRAREIEAPRPWLMRVASNRAMDLRRRLSCRPEGSLVNVGQGMDDEPDNLVPMEQLIRVEANQRQELYMGQLTRRIEELAATLPERQLQAFSLRHFQGMSLKEVAEVMECTVGAVKAHLHLATAKIRTTLRGEGYLATPARDQLHQASEQ